MKLFTIKIYPTKNTECDTSTLISSNNFVTLTAVMAAGIGVGCLIKSKVDEKEEEMIFYPED